MGKVHRIDLEIEDKKIDFNRKIMYYHTFTKDDVDNMKIEVGDILLTPTREYFIKAISNVINEEGLMNVIAEYNENSFIYEDF